MVTASSRRAPKYYRSSEAITGTMSGYGFAVGSSGYDDEDRLVNWERDDTNLDQSWSLSLVGDWSSITENSSTQLRTHGSAHQILTAASQSITHDVKGNMTSIPAVLRPGSDPLALSWDFDNRMTGADVDNDSTDDVTYQFDALGRRVQRDDGTDETIFVQNGQQTFADYASGTAATSSDYNYVYASYIDEPVYRDGTGGSRYYHRGQQYSITALTDSTAAIKERYAYSAYGVLSIFDGSGTARTSTAEGNRYTYTGREWDDVAELYHFRARMYDPLSGRFLGRDPIGYLDGASLYAGYFVPLGMDPLGLIEVDVQGRDSHREHPWWAAHIKKFGVAGRTYNRLHIRCHCNANDLVECSLKLESFIIIDSYETLLYTLLKMRRAQEDITLRTLMARFTEYTGGWYGHEQLHVRNAIAVRNDLAKWIRKLPAEPDCMPCDAWASIVEQRTWDYWEKYLEAAGKHEVPSKDNPKPVKSRPYPPDGPLPFPLPEIPEPFLEDPPRRPPVRSPQVPPERKIDLDDEDIPDWLRNEW